VGEDLVGNSLKTELGYSLTLRSIPNRSAKQHSIIVIPLESQSYGVCNQELHNTKIRKVPGANRQLESKSIMFST
jgi:hypothetical protein